MSQALSLLMIASIAVLVAELLYRLVIPRAGRVRLLPRAVAVLMAGSVVYMLAPRNVATIGSVAETAAIVFCYLAMIFGMMAEYFYTQAERLQHVEAGKRKLEFDLLSFLMPVFASPIVFIPLLTLTSDVAAGGGAFSRAKVMVYLVAFQNGFFWKSFFEQRKSAAAAASPVERPELMGV